MKTSKIKYLVLLGLLATWATRQKKRRGSRMEAGERGLAPLVGDLPSEITQGDEVPSAVNPFPKGNPTPLPTGPEPGG